ncbi:MAG: CGGC domain-containing protein [Bacteroidales bacterium]
MPKEKKIETIICNRYRNSAGRKCFWDMKILKGAFDTYFDTYDDNTLEIIAYITNEVCPAGNIEYASQAMHKNGVDVIHLATDMMAGDPPSLFTAYFKQLIKEKYNIPVLIDVNPISQKYGTTQKKLETLESNVLQKLIAPTLCDEQVRLLYDSQQT